MESIKGYLLTRNWRDTASGIELTYWAATTKGPLRVSITGQRAVCFIEQKQTLALPAHCTRKPLALKTLESEPCDALYFQRQRDLQQFRQLPITLYESDIKPADRFLMERFIHAGFEASGDIQHDEYGLFMINPKMTSADVEPSLTAVSLDIETRGHTQQLYSVAVAPMQEDDKRGTVFMIGENQSEQHNDYCLQYVPDEKTLLSQLFAWLNDVDPDLLVGWAIVGFDLAFLETKCRTLGVPFAIGRGSDSADILQPGTTGQQKLARLPGRPVLDGIDLLKAGFWSFDSFSLDNVSNELLGTGKLINSEQDKVEEINRLFANDKPALADYNYQDTALVNQIFAKADLISFAVQRANLTGLAIDRQGGSVAALDNLYLPRLHRHGFVAPDVDNVNTGLGSPGGYVFDSLPGLYENVLVLDFKSLYPSIIRTFFIDPMGLAQPGADPVPGFFDAKFSRKDHILPGLITELWQARDKAKSESNAALSQAIKIIMNSFYGVLGSSGCRFHSQQLASSITRRGHEIITLSRDKIEEHGFQVIYGDTDSLFVHLGKDYDVTSAQVTGQELVEKLNTWWTDKLMQEHKLESQLEMEFETHFTRFLMPTVRGMPTGSKKRYAGLVTKNNKEALVVKGLEAARTDWTPLARSFQRELFRRVFLDLPFETFVRETAEAMQAGEMDEQLAYKKRIRRKLSDYIKNVPPHVQAARKLPKVCTIS
jgi:DNA polymerase-2